jgi:hypothetical protein
MGRMMAGSSLGRGRIRQARSHQRKASAMPVPSSLPLALPRIPKAAAGACKGSPSDGALHVPCRAQHRKWGRRYEEDRAAELSVRRMGAAPSGGAVDEEEVGDPHAWAWAGEAPSRGAFDEEEVGDPHAWAWAGEAGRRQQRAKQGRPAAACRSGEVRGGVQGMESSGRSRGGWWVACLARKGENKRGDRGYKIRR